MWWPGLHTSSVWPAAVRTTKLLCGTLETGIGATACAWCAKSEYWICSMYALSVSRQTGRTVA